MVIGKPLIRGQLAADLEKLKAIMEAWIPANPPPRPCSNLGGEISMELGLWVSVVRRALCKPAQAGDVGR